jgi:hypothetical protein
MARDGLEEGQVWPVDVLVSDKSYSANFTAGYHCPSFYRGSKRFAEHPAFREANNDYRVLVVGREANPTGISWLVAGCVALAIVGYVVAEQVTHRWDIAACIGTVMFGTLNMLLALLFFLMK